jgi:clan AA aspartic protease (TIGR02281 family)
MAASFRTGLFCAALIGAAFVARLGSAGPPGEHKDDSAQPKTPEAAARIKLSEKGIKVGHSGLSLIDEKELAKAFAEANTLRRKLLAASKEQQAADQQIEQLQDNLRELRQVGIAINSQLGSTGANLAARNQLIGENNANVNQINLLEQRKEESKTEMDVLRRRTNGAKETYVQQVAEIRTIVDRLSERYTALKSDAGAQAALADWNAAANTKFEIKPSSYFLNSVKKLEQLEKTVTSKKIPLRREGNSYYATVVINGKPPIAMVVDTGASCVVLPYKLALDCGAKPDESSATAIASIADGSRVKSKVVWLDSVKVGSFPAGHVECMVLPAEATNAHALLGMTFLSRFHFSISGNELIISRIEDDHAPAKPKKTRASKLPRKAKKSTNPAESSE